MRRVLFIMLSSTLLTVLLAGAASCGAPPLDPRPPDIVVILVDTLRQDHLGHYGYERSTSPRLDRLASSSTLYMRAYSHAPWTTPSVAALLTGLVPSRLGITDLPDALPDDLELLAEHLRSAGYTTAAVVSHDFLGSGWNFQQGFDTFHEEWAVGHAGISSPGVTDAAQEAIDAAGDAPLFLFVHYFDPHSHYLRHDDPDFTLEVKTADDALPDRITPRYLKERREALRPVDIAWTKALYDSEIAFTDRHIGRLLDHLQARDRLDSSLVVFTADHGEEFGEHGDFGHTNTLYDELVRVPLLIKLPQQTEARQVDTPAAQVDLLPTILNVAGIAVPEHLDGVSLLEPRDANRPLFCETARGRNLRAVVQGRYKLIRDLDSDELQLYDLFTDPGERHDLATDIDTVARLAALLDAWIEQAVPLAPGARARPPDEATRKRLETLGYVD